MNDPLAYLFGLERLGMKFGLEHITLLCRALGHPERSFRSIIVAGTNGKGSVTVMVETALRAGGHRTARYTSPHLVALAERFVIDGAEVGLGPLREAAARVQSVVESLLADGTLDTHPTFFECTTAIAFELFRNASVDLAVLEVGLGGRLDATNVVSPIAAAITSIDLDHQAQLGNTIEAIAREKAGVIKAGIPVVCGPLPQAADLVVRQVCQERGATLVRALEDVRVTIRSGGDRSVVDIRSRRRSLEGVTLALRGRHQVDNAAVAVGLLDEVDARGVRAGDAAVRAGLSEAVWPARLERFDTGGVEILLDAAHNPAGARALASYLQEIGWRGITLVFAAMHDKDVAGMLDALLPFCGTVVCTTAPSPRAVPAGELATAAAAISGTAVRIEAIADPRAALERARQSGGRIVAAGSIFLIGPLRDSLH